MSTVILLLNSLLPTAFQAQLSDMGSSLNLDPEAGMFCVINLHTAGLFIPASFTFFASLLP